MPNTAISNRNLNDLPPPGKRRRLQCEGGTILSDCDGTIEDHELCDHLINATTESNKRLRSELVKKRENLARVQGEYDELESSHSQCPYWIQRNELLALASQDRYEKLEKENKKLQDMVTELKGEIRRLRNQGCGEDCDIDGENGFDK